jgi:hypothetical protein
MLSFVSFTDQILLFDWISSYASLLWENTSCFLKFGILTAFYLVFIRILQNIKALLRKRLNKVRLIISKIIFHNLRHLQATHGRNANYIDMSITSYLSPLSYIWLKSPFDCVIKIMPSHAHRSELNPWMNWS